MKDVVTNRAALLLAVAVVVITACSDSGGTQPNLSGPNPSAATGSHGSGTDTAKNGGAHDSSGSHTPTQNPVAKFTLKIHVGSPAPGATDTLTTNPVQNVTVTIMLPTYTYSGGAGSDTVNITNTVVATGSSDANGDVAFPNLSGTGIYLIRADPPTGSALGPATADVIKAYSDVVSLRMTLHGR